MHRSFGFAAMQAVAERSVIQLIMSYPQRCGDGHGELSVKPGRKASGGEIGSENVDMSSDKEGERPSRRKSKGSCLKLI